MFLTPDTIHTIPCSTLWYHPELMHPTPMCCTRAQGTIELPAGVGGIVREVRYSPHQQLLATAMQSGGLALASTQSNAGAAKV